MLSVGRRLFLDNRTIIASKNGSEQQQQIVPIVAVLEGEYDLAAIASSAVGFVQGLLFPESSFALEAFFGIEAELLNRAEEQALELEAKMKPEKTDEITRMFAAIRPAVVENEAVEKEEKSYVREV